MLNQLSSMEQIAAENLDIFFNNSNINNLQHLVRCTRFIAITVNYFSIINDNLKALEKALFLALQMQEITSYVKFYELCQSVGVMRKSAAQIVSASKYLIGFDVRTKKMGDGDTVAFEKMLLELEDTIVRFKKDLSIQFRYSENLHKLIQKYRKNVKDDTFEKSCTKIGSLVTKTNFPPIKKIVSTTEFQIDKYRVMLV